MKRKTSLTVLCVMFSLVAICWASAAFAQMGKKGEVPDFIQHFDKNGDGKVSKQEFTGPENYFTRLDKNNDGFIDETEKPTAPPPRGGNMMQSLDKDGDGKISKEEFRGPAEVFTRMDKNHDGFVEPNEMPAAPPSVGGNMMQNLDQNKDGKISKEEFTGPDEVFTRMDKNHDGFIEQNEMSPNPPLRGGNMIQTLDKNKDGKVSKEEFPGPAEHFDRLDSNKDGYLDESELIHGQQNRRGKKEMNK